MGSNLHILAEGQVNNILDTIHGRSACLELRENFHDHVGDQRAVWSKEEFLAMSDHWAAARKRYDEMGQPEPAEQNLGIAQRFLPPKGFHDERIALEMSGKVNTDIRESVHFHYNNLRIHMAEPDFYAAAAVWEEAKMSYGRHYAETVKLSDPKVSLGQLAQDLYIPWLKEYEGGADPDAFWDMFLQSKRELRPEDEQRYSRGWAAEGRTRRPPDDFNRRYLYTMYECMRKYGYAKGPFLHQYVHGRRLPDDYIALDGRHRTACLSALGYDEIKVILPKEWK